MNDVLSMWTVETEIHVQPYQNKCSFHHLIFFNIEISDDTTV